MKHFLDVDQLSSSKILELVQRALFFKSCSHNHEPHYPMYPGVVLLHVFYENSTRTQLSFDLAAKHLGLTVLNLDPKRSSESKGEAMQDMCQTFAAMGVRLMVMRHPEDGALKQLSQVIPDALQLVNAGDGMHAHPTQAMLDMMTIMEHKLNPRDIKIALVGNIRHSRVAQSLQRLCRVLDVGELALIGPEAWLPKHIIYGEATSSLQDGLNNADVVMTLRVQHERFSDADNDACDLATYRQNYAITSNTLQYAKPNALVMHPGPMNRGVEIDSDVADGAQSCILQQVQNGVFMRMAILEWLIQASCI
ncbi:MAG: aspartate carbamoyltransferase catalytic subunit [Legionellaceae bacterium]|nr:aspartate carbamoyltransferase catalytic subunit [Legionellaceae bacterium]